MIGSPAGTIGIFPGPPDFVLLHEKAMPQKDQLCGAFWGALTLSAAGYATSQEEVALKAGTTLAEGDIEEALPEPHLMEGDPSELDGEERRRRGIRPLPDTLEAALDALESDADVRSWFSKNLLDCYLSVKRTEISLLEGVDPQEACERYLRVY